jgi:MFS transporter, TsgA protein
MSGLVTPIGLLTASAAEQYGVEITLIASQFSYFIGGIFVGYIFSFVVFDYFRMKSIIVTCYLIAFISILAIHYISVYKFLPYLLVIIGVTASIVACAGGTLITRLWLGKRRQSVLVAQDAMFNGGGVIFAYIATFFINNNFAWSATYMVVGGIFLFVAVLAILSSFDSGELPQKREDEEGIRTEWNAGFLILGLSLLLFLLAKISLFVWAPQFVEQKFAVGSEESGQFMSNIFTSAFFGSVAGTYIVSRVNVKYVLYSLVILAVLSTWLFTQSSSLASMLLLGFVFGISISATYNSYVAFALTFVAVPTHRHIAYLLLMGGLGSALAPLISSKVVEMSGNVGAAINMCTYTFALVIVTLVIGNLANTLKTRGLLDKTRMHSHAERGNEIKATEDTESTG